MVPLPSGQLGGVTNIVCVRISNVRASRRALGVAALALQREHRRRLRVLGSVLDVIDADRFIRSRPGDEGPIRIAPSPAWSNRCRGGPPR